MRPNPTLIPLPVPSPSPALRQRFTIQDRMALEGWRVEGATRGYCRVVTEAGDGWPDYALVYAPGRLWAVWGIALGASGMLVWHCGTGADLGRFASMAEALHQLPSAATARLRAAPPPRPCRIPIHSS